MNRFYQSLAALMLLLATGGMSPLWGQTTLINPSTDGGFELGSTLADNGWVAVNGAQTNKWFVGGVATSFAGANSAYISSNTTGTTYDYDVNSASGVSFYKDITIPAGESKLQISFRWKSAGETCCDYLRVWLAPVSFTPTAGTQTATGTNISGNLNAQTVYQQFNSTLPVIPGQSYRIIFEWWNDGSLGPSPAASVDDVSVVSNVPGTFISVATGNWSAAATWDANAVPTAADNAIVSAGHTVTVNQSGTIINALTVDGILAYGATPTNFTITNNLSVSSLGVVNVFNGTTGKTLLVGGNIVNNGSIDISVGGTTGGNLTLNGAQVQTVSGTGTFVNSIIRNLTCSNTNTATPNINWLVNDIKIAYNLNISGARINLGTNKLTWGNNAAGNTFTAPAGTGFLAGGKFSRWWTTGQTGSAITAGAEPTTVTSRYPFINAAGQSRAIYISRSSSTVTGNVAGELAVVYSDAATVTTSLNIDDAGYIVTDRFDGSWLVTAENGYVYVSGTHTVVPIATGAYPAANGNSRVLTSNAVIGGTHQNGTSGPVAQRIGLSTAELTIPTGIYIGANTTDIFQPCSGAPTSSNSISSVATVCSGVNFNLSLSIPYTETGITYQWQSSPDGVTYSNISGATNATYVATQTSATFYQCIVTCVNSGQSITTTPVQVLQNNFQTCYCTPTYSNGCGGTGADAITNVTLGGLNNSSGCAATPYYTYYNAVTVPDLVRGATMPLSVSFGSDGSQFAGVWIDFNQNGLFSDPGEFVAFNTVTAGASGTVNFNIAIPAGATLGVTRMRIRGGNDTQLLNTPCGASSSTWGETEDYNVNLIDAIICSGSPVAATTNGPVSVCSGVNFNLTLSEDYTSLFGITYQWQSSPDGITFSNISGATNTTYSTSQTATTYYQCIITCGPSGQSTISVPVLVNTYSACLSMPVSGSLATCDAKFYDSGGPAGNYGNNENRTFTFFPGTPGGVVVATFVSFATEAGWDYLRIYNGNSTAAPALHTGSGFNGASINPTVFTSTAADGSLTFQFTSDGSGTPAGWDATISCILPPTDPSAPVQDPAMPSCIAGTDLSVPGTPPAGDAWYWQTAANGTSTSSPVSGIFTVFQNGTYYVRSFNSTTGLWSVNSTSITVSNIPVATAPPAPVAAASPACLTTTISVAAPVDPNVTYFWQGTVANGIDNSNDAASPFTVTASGTYYVSAFDVSTGCWSEGVGVAVLVDTYVPDAPTAASPFDFCIGAASASISATAPSSSSQIATSGTISIPIPDNDLTGISNVLAISGVPSGAVVASVAVTVNIPHTFNADLDIYLTGPNGTTIELSTDNGGSSDNYTNTVFSNLAINPITGGTGPFTGLFLPEGDLTTLFSLPNGNWTLRVADDLGGDLGTLTSWSVEVAYTVPVSTVTWHDAASGPSQIGTGNTIESIGTTTLPNGNTPGTYSFYAQSESGACSSLTRAQVDVVINPFSATVTAVDVTCNGANNGTFTVTAPNCGTAPYEYAVDGGAYTSTIPANLTPGAHTVMVRDDNGFETALYSITITQPAQLIASETHVDVLCNGAANGSIDVTITGGTAPYAFTWSNGAIGEDQTGIVAGTYNLVVTDNRGCNAFASVNITQPTAVVIAETHNNLNCNGDASGSIDLSVSGGIAPYTYSWSNGATTEDLSTLAAGAYVVTVTDDNACTSTLSVSITEPAVLAAVVATATQPSACGATDGALDVAVTGGVAPYTFAWSNAETTEDISAIGAGLYTLTAADDNGCFVVLNTSLSDPNAPVAVVDLVNNILCFGAATGSIDVTVSGGVSPYTYFWSGGSTSEDLSNATAGVYTLTVTADDGCQTFASATITQNAEIVIASVTTSTLCNGDNNGAIDITVTGGVVATAYDYSWSNSSITEDITALAAGNYTVTITDDNLCTATSTITVTEPAVLAAVGVVTNVSCNGLGNGSINLTITGGTPAYDVLWSSGAVTEDVSGLAPASYTVTVTDDNACVATASFTITEPTVLGATATSTDEINGNDGSVNLTVTGGSTPYSFAWNNSATTEDLSGVVAGNYSVTVTDANGCTATVSITVGSQVGVNELGVRVINIYPNPSNGIFYIEMNGQPESGDRIFVRDALGRLVLEENIMQNRITLNLDTHERGFYLVEVWSAGQRSVHRIQLQR